MSAAPYVPQARPGIVCTLTRGGPLTVEDAAEVGRFKAYLEATAHLPRPGRAATAQQRDERAALYRAHYPEHAPAGPVPS